MVALPPLGSAPSGHCPEIRPALRMLRGSHKTVAGLFDAVSVLDVQRRQANPSARGRMAQDATDILRSAIVLTGSGLDATMKRLVNDAGRFLIGRANTGARAQYEQYLKHAMSQPSTPDGLKNAIVSEDPGAALLDYYLGDRTKASYQGSGDLKKRVRTVLGLSNSDVPDAVLDGLDPFFVARNQIVHDMDYRDPLGTGTARVSRASEAIVAMCNGVFHVALQIVSGAFVILRAAR